jgi:hypothetical protein
LLVVIGATTLLAMLVLIYIVGNWLREERWVT